MDERKARKATNHRPLAVHASAGMALRWALVALAVVVVAGWALATLRMHYRTPEAGPKAFVVALPMYEVSGSMKMADDIFWGRLRARLAAKGIAAPVALERTGDDLVDQWQGERLLLSQTCGFPYVHLLEKQGVKIVGTPVYASNNDLPPGEYRSVVIVNASATYRSLSDLRGKRAGVNDMDSNSGMNAFRAAIASSFPESVLAQGVFASVTVTGGHLNSVRMVADGRIDVAAIDSVSYDLITRDYPELALKTRVLMNTPASPGLPLITGSRTDDATIEQMRIAIKETVTNPGDVELRGALAEMKLKDFVVIGADTYRQRINQLEDMARDKGYPVLK